MKDAKGHGSEKRSGGVSDRTQQLLAHQRQQAQGQPYATHQSGVANVGKPMISQTALDTIRANPGGFSVRPDGTQPTSGFMVSMPGHTKIVSENELSGPNGHQIINDYAREHAGALRDPSAHVGGWTDKDTGKTHLDVSQNIPNRGLAVAAGRSRNQISIWDVKRGEEIKTGGTGDRV